MLTGADDAVVELARNAAGPAAVHISGNSASRYFAVRAVGTEDDLVISLRPYEGVRSLNWNGGESTGFEVRATGSWRIEVLPLSAIRRSTPHSTVTGIWSCTLLATARSPRSSATMRADTFMCSLSARTEQTASSTQPRSIPAPARSAADHSSSRSKPSDLGPSP